VWLCGNEQADGNTFHSPIVAARALTAVTQNATSPTLVTSSDNFPPQTELITACWHSVIETQFGGQHNCLFSVVSPSCVAQDRIQACKMNGPCCLAYWVLHAVVAVQPHVFSNSAADSGKMSTACVTCLTSEARATLMQHRKSLGSQNRLHNYWLFRNLYNDSVVLNLSTDTRQSVVV
jgi:hypothetical protein